MGGIVDMQRRIKFRLEKSGCLQMCYQGRYYFAIIQHGLCNNCKCTVYHVVDSSSRWQYF